MRRWVLRLGLVGGLTSASTACTSSSNVGNVVELNDEQTISYEWAAACAVP